MGATLLILANKQDIEGALAVADIEKVNNTMGELCCVTVSSIKGPIMGVTHNFCHLWAGVKISLAGQDEPACAMCAWNA